VRVLATVSDHQRQGCARIRLSAVRPASTGFRQSRSMDRDRAQTVTGVPAVGQPPGLPTFDRRPLVRYDELKAW